VAQVVFVYGVIVHSTGRGPVADPWWIHPCRRVPTAIVIFSSSPRRGTGIAATAGTAALAAMPAAANRVTSSALRRLRRR
jgi:hypothetical protein